SVGPCLPPGPGGRERGPLSDTPGRRPEDGAERCPSTSSRTGGWLGEREIEVLDGFVDFGGALRAYGDAVDTRVAKRKPHRLLPVLALEGAFAAQLHGDHAQALLVDLL